ncbi:hypothetical protein F2P81_023130 [Scophthalmus maximus]|uniref:Homocysteine-responsive endoplasmic reticulum-resident ubiquitin-like domain member 2 protein n=1 Tax=Scophthalmus maximus TaxID=52904 RepID=A0A6A4RWQ0_SCOMX|nr:hypothetical protein F2P81_023130 [Scophthalmus maximus]
MDRAVVDSPVTLVIRAPNQNYDDQTISCLPNWTVEKLKAHLADVYPSKPSSKDQRLVYSGKLLLDHFTLKDVLRKHDEYHMLHLVCASRTPPSSPKPPRSHGNKPRENQAGPAPLTSSSSSSTGPTHPSPAAESSDGLRHGAGPFPSHQMYSQFMHSQLLAAAASYTHLGPDQPSAQLHPPDALSQRPQADHRGNPEVQMNAQGGEVLNEEELNWDWLDWVYTFSRAAILLSIVYFYSSFSRFVMVMMAMLVLYLHQAGWFPFNLENELQLPGDRANQDEEGLMDDGSDDDGESGEEGAEDPDSGPQAGFLASTWSFIITFFMSLIPEGPPNAAN